VEGDVKEGGQRTERDEDLEEDGHGMIQSIDTPAAPALREARRRRTGRTSR
jgi:hypothetical protein